MERPIEVDDYLAIAAALLGVGSAAITRIANIPLAESALHAPFASFGGQDFYPDPVQKAGVLCSRLVRNHPLPDANKRAAYLSMLMFLEINQLSWRPPNEVERALAVEALAARTMSEGEFIDWLRRYAIPER
jgi:death-on-curing protein